MRLVEMFRLIQAENKGIHHSSENSQTSLSKLPLRVILGRTYGIGALAETCAKLKKTTTTTKQIRRQLYKVTKFLQWHKRKEAKAPKSVIHGRAGKNILRHNYDINTKVNLQSYKCPHPRQVAHQDGAYVV